MTPSQIRKVVQSLNKLGIKRVKVIPNVQFYAMLEPDQPYQLVEGILLNVYKLEGRLMDKMPKESFSIHVVPPESEE